MGTMSSGQGHETSFAQLVTEWLGVPFESINYVAHAARVRAGGGSNSGRSMKLAATIIGNVETGAVEIVRFVAVDDVGRAVNPMTSPRTGPWRHRPGRGSGAPRRRPLRSGERTATDRELYGLRDATRRQSPLAGNGAERDPLTLLDRLGVRSAGEGGTTPALAAVINAVVDALAELGISHIELPATPERVWRAIQAAGQGR